MKKISEYFSSKRILIVVAVVCCVLIFVSFFTGLLLVPLRNAISAIVVPVQKGVNYIGSYATYQDDRFRKMEELEAENKELSSKVENLTDENNKLKQEEYELERLRNLFDLSAQYEDYPVVGARIIGSSTDNWYTTFTIDKGEKQGITVDMNVIADGGLVGIVRSVTDNSAIVQCIVGDGAYVSAQLLDTGDKCTINGDIRLGDEGLLAVNYFKSGVNVKDGDKIITSNISDKYLSGILIGYAKDIKVDGNNLTQSGYVVPVVDFNHLQEVLVITKVKNSNE